MAAQGAGISRPPPLLPFAGDWSSYEDRVYEAFVENFVRCRIRFRGWPVKAQFRPEMRGKGFGFWHDISEAPDRNNRNENDRIPDLRRCQRITWIRWAIEAADRGLEESSWWENQWGRETRVVIWMEEWDFAVVLARRGDYHVLKTAFTDLRPHRVQTFSQKGKGMLLAGQKRLKPRDIATVGLRMLLPRQVDETDYSLWGGRLKFKFPRFSSA